MLEKEVSSEVQIEERPTLQERFCEVPTQEFASWSAESNRSHEVFLATTLGFVP